MCESAQAGPKADAEAGVAAERQGCSLFDELVAEAAALATPKDDQLAAADDADLVQLVGHARRLTGPTTPTGSNPAEAEEHTARAFPGCFVTKAEAGQPRSFQDSASRGEIPVCRQDGYRTAP
jgi:hypothetical protein